MFFDRLSATVLNGQTWFVKIDIIVLKPSHVARLGIVLRYTETKVDCRLVSDGIDVYCFRVGRILIAPRQVESAN